MAPMLVLARGKSGLLGMLNILKHGICRIEANVPHAVRRGRCRGFKEVTVSHGGDYNAAAVESLRNPT